MTFEGWRASRGRSRARDPHMGTNLRQVTLSGSEEGMRAAKQMIDSKVAEVMPIYVQQLAEPGYAANGQPFPPQGHPGGQQGPHCSQRLQQTSTMLK